MQKKQAKRYTIKTVLKKICISIHRRVVISGTLFPSNSDHRMEFSEIMLALQDDNPNLYYNFMGLMRKYTMCVVWLSDLTVIV